MAGSNRRSLTPQHLYAGLALVLVMPFFAPGLQIATPAGPQAREMFRAVQAVPPGKLVVLALDFDTGTIGENLPQAHALIEHLMRRGTRFAIMGFDPVGPKLGLDVAEELGRRYGRVEGRDWVDWGFIPPQAAQSTLLALARDVHGAITRTIPRDRRGIGLRRLPVMRGIDRPRDIGLVIDITQSGSYEWWMQFFTQKAGVPFAVAPTAIMSPGIYPFLDSGQVKGMLNGLKGAAEYETLLHVTGQGTRQMMSVTMGQALIITVVLAANLVEIVRRRRARR